MFKTLNAWGRFIEVIGWIIGIFSMILFLTGLIAYLQSSRGSFGGGLAIASLVPSLGGILAGIYSIITGQAIRCFVAIEENTRETNRLLRSGQTEKKPDLVKQAAAGSILGLTGGERAAESGVKRIAEMERQKPSTINCPSCGKSYPKDSRGQFCEECGTRL